MTHTFYKYQGTGNDFIMVDNRTLDFPKNNTKLISRLCHRNFGIGADGLILLENDADTHFRMVYYNSDGNESSMCGNGGRCIVAFARFLGVIKKEAQFIAPDGMHHAVIDDNGIVSLQMKDVAEVKTFQDHVFLDTGSPHHVTIINDIVSVDVKSEGKAIRYSDLYGEKGANINFVMPSGTDKFSVRTYERGVEDETLSCGTGVTAVAIAMNFLGKTNSENIELQTPGGLLEVSFNKDHNGYYKNVWLKGVAAFVFKGEVEW